MFTEVSKKNELLWVVLFGLLTITIFSVIYLPKPMSVFSLRSNTASRKEVVNTYYEVERKVFTVSAASEQSLVACLAERNSSIQKELSPVDIINGYVDEIVTTRYPTLDPIVIKAIIHHESRYSPEAVNSKTGVVGLMQVSKKWHTKRAQALGVDDLMDAYGNILVGCDILNEIYTQYHSINYAIDVFAGGYKYANSYRGSISPYRRDISKIICQVEAGELMLGGD